MEKKKAELFDEDELLEEDDTQKDRYLTFRLADEDYGIEICHVTEIIGLQKITQVPDMPDFVKGVINLRGQVIPVMDVRARFHQPARDYDDRTCIVVVQIGEARIGLIVDTVSEVRDIPAESVSPPPQIAKGTKSRYIKGMGRVDENVKILLDVNKLLFEEELAQLP
ncbi:MAG: chemotaxis protein CheW [Deltaproteobacteria bacterium]|nr:chemotaxis protein CheW [Deltaproteobacteria bacterium]